jgi:tRNA nucleotidyltransferase/poly(A) polymerase
MRALSFPLVSFFFSKKRCGGETVFSYSRSSSFFLSSTRSSSSSRGVLRRGGCGSVKREKIQTFSSSSATTTPSSSSSQQQQRRRGEGDTKRRKFSSSSTTRIFFSSRCFSSLGPIDPPKTMKENAEILLTEKEDEVFSLLLDVCEKEKEESKKLTLRVAGGWVRDKLLGLESNDIDVALDKCLGAEFAAKVNEYLTSKGEDVSGVGVIQSNPEQSKHLETATMKVRDVWLDFVNLRSESYADESRIPTMSFGTPLEDAMRRDLTINALYYNLNEKKVEDFTGKGIEDLKIGLCRTPLEAKRTFVDDPLRVLRAVRFASRYAFKLAEDIGAAVEDEQVREGLRTKVSRERVGKEVAGMLRGPNPHLAVDWVTKMKMGGIVMDCEETFSNEAQEFGVKAVAVGMRVAMALGMFEGVTEGADSSAETDRKERFYLALWLLGLREIKAMTKKKKEVPLSEVIVMESLKLRNKDAESVVRTHSNIDGTCEVIFHNLKTFTRTEAGLKIRSIGNDYDIVFIVAAIEDALRKQNSEDIDEGAVAESVIEKCKEAFSRVKDEFELVDRKDSVGNPWELKPILDGKEVMKAVGMEKPGPLLKQWIEKTVEWQFEFPGMDKAQCEAKLKDASGAEST